MSERLQIALLRGLFRMLAWLPPRLTGAVGAGLGRAAFYLHGRRRAIAVRNVTRIYPERNRRWRQRVARESFAELGRVIMELPHVFLRPKAWLQARVTVENEACLREALAENQGVIVTACHHGNWELGALMFSLLGFEADMLYRPLRHAGADALLKEWRERFSARLHARRESLKWLPRARRRNAVVALMVDQHIGDGEPVPFLGHLANTLMLPAVTALKHDMPVLSVALMREGRDFRFRLRFWRVDAPSPVGHRALDAFRLMQAINDSFDAVIRQRPELWMWSHQRWKLLEEQPDIAEAVHGTP